MKRLLGACLALALLLPGGNAEGQKPARMDETGWDALGAPAGCAAGYVGVFLGSPLSLGCDAGLSYDPATDTLTVGALTGAVSVTFTGGAFLYGAGTELRSTVDVAPWVMDSQLLGLGDDPWKNLYLSRATLGSKSKAIVDATPTAVATFTIADGATYGGKLIYNIVSTQGTAKQRLDGEARFSATREGSTYTVTINEIGTQTLAAAEGTLTGAMQIAGTAGVVTISANFNTSQTPDTFVCNLRFDSPDAALALTFP